jgi:hypothetical protein
MLCYLFVLSFLFRHFVFDNIPESPIIKSKFIHDNIDSNDFEVSDYHIYD